MANTFVYTVLLMIITGTTMYLVYGRSVRKSRKRVATFVTREPEPAASAPVAVPAPAGAAAKEQA